MTVLWSHSPSDLRCWNCGFWAFTAHIHKSFRSCHQETIHWAGLLCICPHFSLIHKPLGESVQGKYLFEQEFFFPGKSAKPLQGCHTWYLMYLLIRDVAALWSLSCLSNPNCRKCCMRPLAPIYKEGGVPVHKGSFTYTAKRLLSVTRTILD